MPRLSPEQLEARRRGMGTTDIIQVMGIAPWQGAGPMAVYVEKKGLAPVEKDENEDAKEWGHWLEPVIAKWYEKAQGVTLFPCGTTRSKQHDWLFCTHDFAIHGQERRGIEIKNVGRWMAHHWNESDPDGIPHYVRVQVTLQMAICEYDEAHVCASIAGSPPAIWPVRFDPELAALAIDAGRTFWTNHIIADTPPAFDGSEAARQYLRAKYPKEETPLIIKATEVMNGIAAARIAAASRRVADDTLVRQCDDELLSFVGSNTGAMGVIDSTTWKLTWKTNKAGVRASRFTIKGGGDD